jgi:AraC-like DNA-binding protein
MSDRLFFSTEVLPERDRFPAFCEELVRRYTGLDMAVANPSQFRATLELQRADAIAIGRIATTPLNSARTQDLIRDGDDGLIVTMLQRGHAYQTQRDEDRDLQAGEAVICDCRYVGALNVTAESQLWNLKIPRRKIASLLPPDTHLAGLKLERDCVARRLLFGYLNGTFSVELPGSRAATRLYEEHIIALVALALGAQGEAREVLEERSLRAVRRAAIMHLIEASFADPRLDAEAVAIRLGITARYVHQLLEETGRTFSEHLLDRRLARVVELLRNPRLSRRKIADIAYDVGFTDLSHFNRSFRRKFGVTPTALRGAP